MRGHLLIAGSVVLLASTSSLAIETKDLAVMSSEIFALYGKDGRGLDLSGSHGRRVLTPGLLALVKADEKAAKGEVGALGADPFCNCQDYEITAVKAVPKLLGPDKAEVSVAFRNFGEPQTTRLSLVKTPGGWRVADVYTTDGRAELGGASPPGDQAVAWPSAETASRSETPVRANARRNLERAR